MHAGGFGGHAGDHGGYRGRGYGGYPYALGAFGLGYGLGAYGPWYDGGPYYAGGYADEYGPPPVDAAPAPAQTQAAPFCGWTWNPTTQVYDRTPC
jgi:hypothetical protein